MYREAVNAEHRDEVASLSGLAAAVDKYEDAPHGDAYRTVAALDRPPDLPECSRCETTVPE